MLGGGGDGSAVGPGSPWTRLRLCCTSSVPRRELSLSWRDIGTGCLVVSTQQWPHAHPASPYRHSGIPISLPIWQHAPPVPQNAAHAPEAPHSSRQATPSWTKLGALTAAARSSNAISGAAPRGPGARSRLRLPGLFGDRELGQAPPFQRLKHVAPGCAVRWYEAMCAVYPRVFDSLVSILEPPPSGISTRPMMHGLCERQTSLRDMTLAVDLRHLS